MSTNISGRKLQPGKLVIASHNAGKVREIRALLEPFGIDPVSAGDLGLPEPEETGTTFAENALLRRMPRRKVLACQRLPMTAGYA